MQFSKVYLYKRYYNTHFLYLILFTNNICYFYIWLSVILYELLHDKNQKYLNNATLCRLYMYKWPIKLCNKILIYKNFFEHTKHIHSFSKTTKPSLIFILQVQNESATGSSTSNRVRTILTIRVENIDFDTQACMLRLKGRNIEENQYVKVRTC